MEYCEGLRKGGGLSTCGRTCSRLFHLCACHYGHNGHTDLFPISGNWANRPDDCISWNKAPTSMSVCAAIIEVRSSGHQSIIH